MLERDAIVMSNTRKLIKGGRVLPNWQLYMRVFGTGSNQAKFNCRNQLGLDPDSVESNYAEMMTYIQNQRRTTR